MASDLHKELSYRAISWMSSRMTASGIRWATELNLENGWVADCVAFGFPQIRFLRQTIQFNKNDDIKDIWYKGIYPDHLLYVFEVKISKQDYIKSFGKTGIEGYKSKLIGNLNYIITIKDLINENQLTPGWGLLIKSGNGLREIVIPKYNEIDDSFKNKVGYNILWAAYNFRSSIQDWEIRRGELF